MRLLIREKQIQTQRQLQRQQAMSSVEVGEVGQRITIIVKDVRALYSKGSYAYNSPDTFVYKIVGDDGNTYIWSTTNAPMVGDKIVATVKDHKEYEGEKQTVITRGKIFNEGFFIITEGEILREDTRKPEKKGNPALKYKQPFDENAKTEEEEEDKVEKLVKEAVNNRK